MDLRVYDVALTPEEMLNFVECGDENITHTPILTLESEVLEVRGSTLLSRRPQEEVCTSKSNHLVFFQDSRSRNEALLWCRMFKGSLALPSSAEENRSARETISNLFKTQCTNCDGCRYWLGMKGDPVSGIWTKDSDGEPVSWSNAIYGHDIPTEYARCMTAGMPVFPYIWLHAPCSLHLCPLCNFTSIPKLRLRGLCSTSQFDTELYLYGYANGRPRFSGSAHTAIEWNNSTWVMNSRMVEGLNASMEMSRRGDYPLGVHSWHVHGDLCGEAKVSRKDIRCNRGSRRTKNYW